MKFKKYIKIIVLLIALAVVFVIRAHSFSTNIQFDSDFGRDSLFAMRILEGNLTLLGPAASVGGFYLGPLYFYFVAVVYLIFGFQPQALTIIFLLMGAVTVGLGAWLQQKYSSGTAAIIFLLLAATSVPLVTASQSVTHQPMLPLVTLIFLAIYMLGLRKNSLPFDIIIGAVFGLFLHIHFSAFLIFIPLIPLFFWQAKGDIRRKFLHICMFGVGMFLMASPLLLFDLRHDFITTRSLLGYVQQAISGSSIAEARPHLTGGEKTQMMQALLAPQFALVSIGLVASLAMIAWKKQFRKITPYVQTLLVLSLGSGALVYLYQGYLFSYYLLVPLTIWLLLLASLLAEIRPRFLGILLALIISVQSFSQVTYGNKFRTVANLSQILAPIEQDIKKTKPKSFALFKDSSDQMTGLGYEYRFLLARDGYVPHSEYAYEGAGVLYYIREEGFADPLISTHWETTQFGATHAELLAEPEVHGHKRAIFRLTK